MSVLKRLEESELFGIKLGLDNIRAILQELGNPQNSFKSILIAGTNGKGSVAAMLATALIKHSFKTGLYTSPHLVSVHERIRVQGETIPDTAFENVLQEVFTAADRVLANPPTYFEVLTAAAMLHFHNEAIQYGVIEVGMGGRYDATNAIDQSLSIITSIDYDHQQYLGNTLAQIAGEKAAISKPGVPMITGVLPSEAVEVVREACRNTRSPLKILDPTNIAEPRLIDGHAEFVYTPWNQRVHLNLMGRHQIVNSVIVLMAADELKLNFAKTLTALAEAGWPGRLDIVAGTVPPVLLDCAHNPMGARSLAGFLNDIGWNKVNVLFTAMRDKNIAEMLTIIAPAAHSAVLTQVEPLKRCATGEELTVACNSAGIPSVFEPDFDAALEQARARSIHNGMPLILFGSIYLIGRMYSKLHL